MNKELDVKGFVLAIDEANKRIGDVSEWRKNKKNNLIRTTNELRFDLTKLEKQKIKIDFRIKLIESELKSRGEDPNKIYF